jgi:hypothetical protein
MFLESPEAKEKPELTKSIKKVMEHHFNVKEIWTEFKIRFSQRYIECNSEDGKQIIKLYPAVL